MPSLQVTTTQTAIVTLTPAVKRRLLTNLKAYAELKAQRDALDHAIAKHKSAVEDLLAETEESSLAVEGYKATLIAPVRETLDPMKLIAAGVTPAQIKEATVRTSTTPYVKISLPKERGND